MYYLLSLFRYVSTSRYGKHVNVYCKQKAVLHEVSATLNPRIHNGSPPRGRDSDGSNVNDLASGSAYGCNLGDSLCITRLGIFHHHFNGRSESIARPCLLFQTTRKVKATLVRHIDFSPRTRDI